MKIRLPMRQTSHFKSSGPEEGPFASAVLPGILVGLALQALLFQFGGVTTLGVNSLNMALPAIVCYGLFARGIAHRHGGTAAVLAFCCGFLAVFLGALMVALSLVFRANATIQSVLGGLFLLMEKERIMPGELDIAEPDDQAFPQESAP